MTDEVAVKPKKTATPKQIAALEKARAARKAKAFVPVPEDSRREAKIKADAQAKLDKIARNQPTPAPKEDYEVAIRYTMTTAEDEGELTQNHRITTLTDPLLKKLLANRAEVYVEIINRETGKGVQGISTKVMRAVEILRKSEEGRLTLPV